MAYKTVKFGDHRERRSFSTKRSTLELSNLLEVQKDSFDLFLKEGIKEVFEDIFPVESFSGSLSLEFGDDTVTLSWNAASSNNYYKKLSKKRK